MPLDPSRLTNLFPLNKSISSSSRCILDCQLRLVPPSFGSSLIRWEDTRWCAEQWCKSSVIFKPRGRVEERPFSKIFRLFRTHPFFLSAVQDGFVHPVFLAVTQAL
ncbi:hypothetical protein TNIN_349081 [Trichonephila inaurata madagascariensis]|uniref:Uncharacterized protein n=1 Tax=Trichonephila inaurata madagascariensis TaxID=2747483 RepID=A0A8X7CAP7_9ARAC|nr:hypothetical protein TNIN_349081 [Trichonephila inaurata madagascariensis]